MYGIDDKLRSLVKPDAAGAAPCRAEALTASGVRSAKTGAPVSSEPLPLMREAAKPASFPIDALGPVLGPAAKAIARAVQVPGALAGQSVLAAAALAVQGLADVETPYGERKPVSLFLMTIAASGDRKSTADKLALRGVREFEKEAIERHRLAMRAYHRAMRDFEVSQKRADKDGGHLPNEPVKPVAPDMVLEDITAQSLVRKLGNNQPSVGLFTSEGGKFIGGYAMSDKGKTHSAAVFNTLWDDGSADRWRIGGEQEEAVRLRGRRLTAHIMVQPGAGGGFLADRSLADQGFLARWLVIGPESIMGQRLWQDQDPEDAAAIKDFASHLKELLTLETRRALDENGQPTNELEPPALQLSVQARSSWVAFYDEVEVRCAPDADLRPIAGFAAKLAEQALRIAGVLTLAENPKAASAVGMQAMANAIALCRHYLGEALRLHGAERVGEDLVQAEQLKERIKKKWPDTRFSVGDVLALNISFIRTSKTARDLLGVLEGHGQVSKEVVTTRTKPGERWRIVPESG